MFRLSPACGLLLPLGPSGSLCGCGLPTHAFLIVLTSTACYSQALFLLPGHIPHLGPETAGARNLLEFSGSETTEAA